MTTAVRQPEPKKTPTKAMRQPPAQTDEPPMAAAQNSRPAGIQPAFSAYLQARKHMANAFRGRERRDRAAYEDAGRRFRIYEEDIDRAISAKERAEREALGLYWETVDRAMEKAYEVYRDRMKLALKDCRQAIEQAWKSSMETSADAVGVFDSDEGILPTPSKSSRTSWLGIGVASVRQSLSRLRRSCLTLFRRAAKLLRRMPLKMARNVADKGVDSPGTNK